MKKNRIFAWKQESKEMEMYSFDRIKDEFTGEAGSEKRTQYEQELQLENADIHVSAPAVYQQIFKEIQTLKRQILPNERVILYGSQARGDARSDSDWDLLVLLNGKGKITGEEDTRYGYPFAELGWRHGVCICALLYSTEEWEKRKMSPFYKNVIHDGIEIN